MTEISHQSTLCQQSLILVQCHCMLHFEFNQYLLFENSRDQVRTKEISFDDVLSSPT